MIGAIGQYNFRAMSVLQDLGKKKGGLITGAAGGTKQERKTAVAQAKTKAKLEKSVGKEEVAVLKAFSKGQISQEDARTQFQKLAEIRQQYGLSPTPYASQIEGAGYSGPTYQAPTTVPGVPGYDQYGQPTYGAATTAAAPYEGEVRYFGTPSQPYVFQSGQWIPQSQATTLAPQQPTQYAAGQQWQPSAYAPSAAAAEAQEEYGYEGEIRTGRRRKAIDTGEAAEGEELVEIPTEPTMEGLGGLGQPMDVLAAVNTIRELESSLSQRNPAELARLKAAHYVPIAQSFARIILLPSDQKEAAYSGMKPELDSYVQALQQALAAPIQAQKPSSRKSWLLIGAAALGVGIVGYKLLKRR